MTVTKRIFKGYFECYTLKNNLYMRGKQPGYQVSLIIEKLKITFQGFLVHIVI